MSEKNKGKPKTRAGITSTLRSMSEVPPMTAILALVSGTIESLGMEMVNVQFNKSRGELDVAVTISFYPHPSMDMDEAGDLALGGFNSINDARSDSNMDVLDIRYNKNPSTTEINMSFVLRLPTPEVTTEASEPQANEGLDGSAE